MRFRGRGRPKIIRAEKDYGTPELQEKRQRHITEEALDCYLRRQLITQNQHWCGIHFRWLYTLRYGIPSVKALDTTHFGGKECKLDDLQWKQEREAEYHHAAMILKKNRCYAPVVNICIYNGNYLDSSIIKNSRDISPDKYASLFKNGMDILESLWCSNND